jgi:hypothetical protein
MKLHLWRPYGHGKYTFIVQADSIEVARRLVDAKVAQLRRERQNYETDGWGDENCYEHEEYDPFEVITHVND